MSNEEKYIAKFNLEINNHIARLTSKIDDEISEVWKIDKKDILEVLNFKENLIEYIEDKINELNNIICEDNMNRISTTYEEAKKTVYLDLLERIRKSNNYEKSDIK